MGLLVLTLVIGWLVLGLEHNARRTRSRLPAVPAAAQPHEHRDRDTERLLDELRAR